MVNDHSWGCHSFNCTGFNLLGDGLRSALDPTEKLMTFLQYAVKDP